MALALLCGAAQAQSPAGPLGLLVPAYINPAVDQTAWNRLAVTATRLPLMVIMNPSNGPGRRADASYATAATGVVQSGGRVLGYVYTSYGRRSLAAVKADVDRYFAWYPVAGIFFDEMAANASSRNLAYYGELAAYVRSKRAGAIVVANPGQAFAEAFAINRTADVFVDAEDPATAVLGAVQASWTAAYPPGMFAELAYEASDDAAVTRTLAQRRLGWLYTTRLPATDPWAALPDDFAAEVEALIGINATR